MSDPAGGGRERASRSGRQEVRERHVLGDRRWERVAFRAAGGERAFGFCPGCGLCVLRGPFVSETVEVPLRSAVKRIRPRHALSGPDS